MSTSNAGSVIFNRFSTLGKNSCNVLKFGIDFASIENADFTGFTKKGWAQELSTIFFQLGIDI
jgi:hypothetical protein